MANVFTRRSHFPRNTYAKDFGPNVKLIQYPKEQRRESSPTRANKPDPSGLHYQPSLKGSEEVGLSCLCILSLKFSCLMS